MIGFIRGTVAYIGADYCIVDVQGVGYRIYIPASARESLAVGKQATLHTYLQVREDALTLYGFVSRDEYDLFTQIITVTGIGPKVANNILSSIRPEEFRRAVADRNITVLTHIPGIGKKTAERMILELKDKVGISGTEITESGKSLSSDDATQAIEALLSLGYSRDEAFAGVKAISSQAKSLEEMVRLALKEMAQR